MRRDLNADKDRSISFRARRCFSALTLGLVLLGSSACLIDRIGGAFSGEPEELEKSASPGARNVISANLLFGISIDGSGTTGNLVIGNYIGVDISGEKALGNKYGITIQSGAQDNVVGGEGEENVNAGTEFDEAKFIPLCYGIVSSSFYGKISPGI